MSAGAQGDRARAEPSRLGEPEWLEGLRRFAAARAGELPLPTGREEMWRGTDIALLEPSRFERPSAAGRRERLRAVPDGTSGVGDLEAGGGLLELLDGEAVEEWLSEGARRAGVLLCGIGRAVAGAGELVRAHLGTLAGPEDHLSARALAEFAGGYLLYVPPGVELEAPLVVSGTISTAERAVTTRGLVVLGEDARVVLDERLTMPEAPHPTLVSATTEVFLGAGARLDLASLSELGLGGVHLASCRARLERGAHLSTLVASFGAELSRSSTEALLAGPGAESLLLGAAAPVGAERVEHHTLQDHSAPGTTSDLLYKSAASDRASSVYRGTIRVRPGAARANAYQASRNLLLSEEATVETGPRLEIENNDVRCTHGATVGPLDEEQRFYLTSRGIPRAEAERLLLEGFFEDLFARIPRSLLGPRLREVVAERIGGAR
jgi:Fe-S cluster assembly protein SufD